MLRKRCGLGGFYDNSDYGVRQHTKSGIILRLGSSQSDRCYVVAVVLKSQIKQKSKEFPSSLSRLVGTPFSISKNGLYLEWLICIYQQLSRLTNDFTGLGAFENNNPVLSLVMKLED